MQNSHGERLVIFAVPQYDFQEHSAVMFTFHQKNGLVFDNESLKPG